MTPHKPSPHDAYPPGVDPSGQTLKRVSQSHSLLLPPLSPPLSPRHPFTAFSPLSPRRIRCLLHYLINRVLPISRTVQPFISQPRQRPSRKDTTTTPAHTPASTTSTFFITLRNYYVPFRSTELVAGSSLPTKATYAAFQQPTTST